MSSRYYFLLTLFFLLCAFVSSSAQDRVEKKNERSPCFSSRIVVEINHCTPGSGDGKISLNLPSSAQSPKIYWFGPGIAKESREANRLDPGFYTVLITDANNCTTRIENIQVKEVQ